MKNQSFCLLKNDDKFTCLNLRFGTCGLLMIFLNGCYSGCTWFFQIFSLRNNTTNCAACAGRNCGVTRVRDTCGVGCIHDICEVACLCSKSGFASLFLCAFFFFFQVCLCELILFEGTKRGFFSLFSFAMSFSLAL